MKKLTIIAVFTLGLISFSVNAQEKKSNKQMNPTTQTMMVGEDFTEIDKSTLPQPIKDAIMNDMDGMMVSKAWMSKDETFMIEVASQEDKTKTKTVYADAEGKWIKPKEESQK